MTKVHPEGKSLDPTLCTVDWETAYRRYSRFWVRLARSNGLSDAEARDAVHTILGVLIADPDKRFVSFEHVRNYVARAVINRATVERQRPDRAVGSSEFFDSILSRYNEAENSAEKDLYRAESTRVLRDALVSLPRRSFEIVKLRFYGGFSFIEISKLLNLPISTLKSREDAALKAIRKSLRKKGVEVGNM